MTNQSKVAEERAAIVAEEPRPWNESDIARIAREWHEASVETFDCGNDPPCGGNADCIRHGRDHLRGEQ